ncbi:hypothetical protein TanjilG_10598 [Lupinus angustifolius]|uniref:Uncharacterized protein n=1 Tax=Lupinus angustifolius TaxID=3871 RepID=A0A4P1RV63_LUPAN|nr:hypothetical protein TanjilG_10598 [Lupinus angustifolius]
MVIKSFMNFSATTEDDDTSVWSIQVNASTHGEDYEDDNMEEIAENGELDYIDISSCDEEEEGDVEYGGLLLDELCERGKQQRVKVNLNPSPCINHVSNSEDNIPHSGISSSQTY